MIRTYIYIYIISIYSIWTAKFGTDKEKTFSGKGLAIAMQ